MAIFFVMQLQCYSQNVLPYYENNKIGMIDTTGKVLIPAKFYQIGKFVNGLAPARLQGTYGYIDLTGHYVIPPIYDFGDPFSEGIARVWLNGKSFLINEKGQRLTVFDNFDGVGDFKNGIASIHIQKGASRLMGLIGKTGNIIFPPIYETIEQRTDSLYIVTKDKQKALINQKHEIIVPFGKYRDIEINKFNDKYAYVSYCANKKEGRDCDTWEGFIDMEGKEVFMKKWTDSSTISYYSRYIQEGLIKFNIEKKKSREEKEEWQILVNLRNETVIDNSNYREIGNFRFGKTFALTFFEYKEGLTEKRFILIDKQGKQVGSNYFEDVEDSYFGGNYFDENGLAFVRKDWLHNIIDTAGNLISTPQFWDFDKSGFHNGYLKIRKSDETVKEKIKIEDNTPDTVYHYQPERYITIHNITTIDTVRGEKLDALFEKLDKRLDSAFADDEKYEQQYDWGIIDTKGKWVVEPKFANIQDTNIPSIWIAQQKDKIGYINSRGKFIWSMEDNQVSKNRKLDTLNLDYKDDAYYSAYDDKQEQEYNGWSKSNNLPNKIRYETTTTDVSIFIDLTKVDTLQNYAYYSFQVANTTKDTVYFDAEDSRLPIILEAKNAKGEWVQVQDYPHSWCGNSYHKLQLAPTEGWSFKVPLYQGVIKTKFRLALEIAKPEGKKTKSKIVYSNEYEGSINPAQFWRLAEKFSTNIMSPY